MNLFNDVQSEVGNKPRMLSQLQVCPHVKYSSFYKGLWLPFKQNWCYVELQLTWLCLPVCQQWISTDTFKLVSSKFYRSLFQARLLLLIINSWTGTHGTHSLAASGAISWPWHWCTSTCQTAVVVGPQALWLGIFMCVCTLALRQTAYQAVPMRSQIYFHQ